MQKRGKGRSSAARRKARLRRYRDRKRCRFCRASETRKDIYIDYKDIDELSKLCTAQGKLFSRKRSGNCAQCQKGVKLAVKYARFLALLNYVE